MLFGRLKLRKWLDVVPEDLHEDFLFDSLKVFRFDPYIYLPFWVVALVFSNFFVWFTHYNYLGFVIGGLVFFHVVVTLLVFFFVLRWFINKWLK